MMRFFGPDSPVGVFSQVAVISMCLFLGTLGVVTFGPALCAACGCCLAIIRGEGAAVSIADFFRRFVTDFRTTCLSGLLFLGLISLGLFDVWFFSTWNGLWARVATGSFLGCGCILTLLGVWFFPQLSQNPGSFRYNINVAGTIVLRWPLRSLLALALVFWPLGVLLVWVQYWAYLLAALFLFGSGLSVYLICLLGQSKLAFFRPTQNVEVPCKSTQLVQEDKNE